MEVPNRFYFGPHGNPGWILAVNGAPSEDYAAYVAERAAGGVGLVMHSLTAVPRGHLQRQSPQSAHTIPAFQAVADGVHRHGAKIFGQLHFAQLAPKWEPTGPPAPTLGVGIPLTQIASLVAAYRQSCANLARAGYDGIEVHANHGQLTEQFLSPYFNKRTDRYGGDLTGRMRFLVEILEASREGVGPARAVGIRINADEIMPDALSRDAMREIVGILVKRKLVDFVDIDLALEPLQHEFAMPTYFFEPLMYRDIVAALRSAVAPVPVLSVLTRVTKVADAERAIADGLVDMVGAVRGLIAEPELVKNAREGREDHSRACIASNMCRAANYENGGWGCAINPASGREHRWGVDHWDAAPHRVKVVVVGAGPSGLEAARTAALRGHEVVVLERRPRVGGQLGLWGVLPGRTTLATTQLWYERRLAALGVTVRTTLDATASMVLAEHPQAVVVATGSHYRSSISPGEHGAVPWTIPGHERDFVFTPEKILEDGARPTGNVIVFDGEGMNTGVGIAELLAKGGARVQLLTSRLQPGDRLVETIENATILRRLRALDVALDTRVYVKEIGDRRVTVFDVLRDSERVIADVDAVVLVTMRGSDNALARELDGKVAQLFLVGDALEPRNLMTATYEGQRFARLIGENDAPRDFTGEYWRLDPSEKVLHLAT